MPTDRSVAGAARSFIKAVEIESVELSIDSLGGKDYSTTTFYFTTYAKQRKFQNALWRLSKLAANK